MSASSRARPSPTMCGSRCSVPMSAVMATSTSLTQNEASPEQTRTSHAVTMSTPAPMHAPWTAAMTGLLQASKAVQASCVKTRVTGGGAAKLLVGACGDGVWACCKCACVHAGGLNAGLCWWWCPLISHKQDQASLLGSRASLMPDYAHLHRLNGVEEPGSRCSWTRAFICEGIRYVAKSGEV